MEDDVWRFVCGKNFQTTYKNQENGRKTEKKLEKKI